MRKDPRFSNETFSTISVTAYLGEYSQKILDCLRAIPEAALEDAVAMVMATRLEGGRIFVGGNGGSAAIAEHLSCDFQKGVYLPEQRALKVHSLTSNTALLTAIGNDFGYEHIFAKQLEMAELCQQDVVILISSSGNSPNIVRAASYAKEKGARVIGFSGFSGGQLRELASISLHVPFNNYGLVEDCHQLLMHVLAQFHDAEFRKRI